MPATALDAALELRLAELRAELKTLETLRAALRPRSRPGPKPRGPNHEGRKISVNGTARPGVHHGPRTFQPERYRQAIDIVRGAGPAGIRFAALRSAASKIPESTLYNYLVRATREKLIRKNGRGIWTLR